MTRGSEWESAHADRYDRIVMVVSPLFIISQYALFLLMYACWRPALTKEALSHYGASTQEKMSAKAWVAFMRETSGAVWNCAFHCIFGSCAMYGATSMGFATPEQALGDFEALLVAGDVSALRLQELAGLMGAVFAALMVHFTFYWFCRWDTDPLQLFHHAAFIGVSLVLARRSAMTSVGLFAMAMEMSSPALAVMTVFRQLEGGWRQRLAFVATCTFACLFMITRVCLFGFALLTTLRLRLVSPASLPAHVPTWEVDVVLLLLGLGWLLQLHWARLIVKKFRRHLARGKENAKEA